MADFLSRLIERSTGRAAVAYPVVAPLFATGPELAADPDPPGELAPVIDRGMSVGASPEGNGFARRESSSVPAAAPSERPPRPPEQFEPLPEHVFPAIPDPAAPALAFPTTSFPVPRASTIAELRSTNPKPGRSLEIPILAEPTRRMRPAPHRAAIRAATSPSHAPEPPAPPPIVRISIGRIDVRAESPAKPATRTPELARLEDRLSLEEYLRRGRER